MIKSNTFFGYSCKPHFYFFEQDEHKLKKKTTQDNFFNLGICKNDQWSSLEWIEHLLQKL